LPVALADRGAPLTSATAVIEYYGSNVSLSSLVSRIAARVLMSKRSQIYILIASGLVFAQSVASLVLPPTFTLTVLSDLTQCILLFSGALSLLPNVVATRGRTRLFWALMTLGVAFWLAYQLLWTYFEVILRQDVPTPFVGDVVLFLHIVPMMAALALQPHVEQDDRTARLGSLDFALLLIWWLYLYLFAVIPWQYAHTNAATYEHAINVLYLTEKMVFLAGLAVVWSRSKGAWRTIYAHWFGASLVYALSSYVANWGIERNTYYSGSLYDVPLVASMAWVIGVGLLASDLSPTQQPAHHSGSHGVWVARLGMITIFSLPLFAAWSVFDRSAPPAVSTFRLVVTLATMLVMGALVFIKQHLLDRELLRLLRTSQESFENLRRVQAQLVQSEKLASLGQLVGGAAHELNNPLTAMLGYADLLAETPLKDEQRVLADKIAQQVRRTKGLVSSLLSFAQQVPAEKILLDMNALAQTAVKLSQPQLRARGIKVHTDLASDLPQILGDSNQLLQVCLHITNNALQAMAQTGGVLSVSTRRHDQFVQLEFSDDGPGAQEPDRVFDPFYTTKPIGQGTGLGLSACYGIIQEHKGKILCQNGPQGGAIFRIELPAVVKEATWAEAPSEPTNDEVQAGVTLTLPPTP
jgi:signal transduction histidine kinase